MKQENAFKKKATNQHSELRIKKKYRIYLGKAINKECLIKSAKITLKSQK